MGGKKIRTSQAVAVEKNAIFSGGSKDGAVTNFGEPESFVRMPHVQEPAADASLPSINDHGDIVGTAVNAQGLTVGYELTPAVSNGVVNADGIQGSGAAPTHNGAAVRQDSNGVINTD